MKPLVKPRREAAREAAREADSRSLKQPPTEIRRSRAARTVLPTSPPHPTSTRASTPRGRRRGAGSSTRRRSAPRRPAHASPRRARPARAARRVPTRPRRPHPQPCGRRPRCASCRACARTRRSPAARWSRPSRASGARARAGLHGITPMPASAQSGSISRSSSRLIRLRWFCIVDEARPAVALRRPRAPSRTATRYIDDAPM